MGLRKTISWLVAVAIIVAMAAPTVAHWLGSPIDQRMVDLDVYRTSGQVVLRGGRLYDFLTQPPQLLPFTYPPFAALLAVPLAWVGWPMPVTLLWAALVFAALTITVWLAFRPLIRRFGPIALGCLVGLATVLMPIGDQIRFGQVDMFLVAMCVADCAVVRTRWPRGMLIGLATAIKLVPGVFLVYLLITGRRREAGNAVLTSVVATLAACALLPRDSVDFWGHAVWDNSRVGSLTGTTNQSMKGMLLRLHLPPELLTLVWGVLLLIVAYHGFRLARRASLLAVASPTDRYVAELTGIAITGLLAVLLSPVAWIHHLAWIVVVIGALAADGRSRRRCWAAFGVFVFFVVPVPWWGANLVVHSPGVLKYPARMVQDGYGLAAVGLVFLLGVWSIRLLSGKTPPDPGDTSPTGAEVGTLTA